MSILAGIGTLVDDWLKIEPKGKPPFYRHRSAANELTQRKSRLIGTPEFLSASYQQIQGNWAIDNETGYSNHSKENWRWKRHLELSSTNKSPELQLERAIVRACGENWSNQMPAASGLVGPHTDKRAAVDLVHKESLNRYSLIELKVDSDNPLFAAIEILLYGLLFVWSRNNKEELGYTQEQPMLAATTVTLSVLAPARYYTDFNLTNLSTALNIALCDFDQRRDLALTFEFSQLGADYKVDASPDGIRSAIDNKRLVW